MLLPLSQVVVPLTIQRYGLIAILTLYTRRRKRLGRCIINKVEFPLCRGDTATRTAYVLSNCERTYPHKETHIEPEHRF